MAYNDDKDMEWPWDMSPSEFWNRDPLAVEPGTGDVWPWDMTASEWWNGSDK